MKLLIVAADPMEIAHIPRREDFYLVAGGAGALRAAAAVDQALTSFHPDAIVSTGFCGALDPKLKTADVVVASSVIAGGIRYPTASGRGAVVCSVDRVVQTAAEKRALFDSGGSVVEMEAAGVAARAAALGLPFYCVKAVSDLAGEDMANDFNRALTADGHFDTMILLTGALVRPLTRIPELLRLRKRCVLAARALGDFFADCRF